VASAAFAGALVLTGCGSDLSHGTITGKQYVPEKHWTYEQPLYTSYCHPVGKTVSCSQMITGYLPIPETDPACWRLNLRDGKKTGHVCVSESAWNKAKRGGQW
jgi:hypothetical protein